MDVLNEINLIDFRREITEQYITLLIKFVQHVVYLHQSDEDQFSINNNLLVAAVDQVPVCSGSFRGGSCQRQARGNLDPQPGVGHHPLSQ